MNTLTTMNDMAVLAPEPTIRQGQAFSPTYGRNVSISVDSCLENVPDIATMLVDEAFAYLDRDLHAGVIIGLSELISNAIEHGNLNISSSEKRAALSEAPNRTFNVYCSHLLDAKFSRRKVHIEADMNDDYCEWTIRDEGNGFDWQRVFKNIASHDSNSLEERGLYLCSMRFDELTYEGKGNVVRARKNAYPANH